ncbi:MAG: uracil-DNA glycosylase, partial [Deefgea sp.]
MSRRALILEELGLSPQWVRHEVLAAIAAEAASAVLVVENSRNTVTPVSNDPHFSPIANAAHHRIEEQIQHSEQKITSSKAAAAHQLLKQNKTNSGPEKVLSSEEINSNDVRSERIQQMSWEELRVEIASCTACPRSQQREQAVFGTGQQDAQLFIVSDAPTKAEEHANLAIVGPAQRMLSQMLISLGEPSATFISNAVKCSSSRNPTSQELNACRPFLQRQISLVQPKAILAIGQFAAEATLNTTAPIRELRNTVQECQSIPAIVSYHP